jgi:16S rRNA (uracil1498-N3)-methyltransferase
MRPGLSRLQGSQTLADRFFCPDSPVDARVALEGDEARHLAKVRRVGVGECVELFDGRGSTHRAEVIAIGRDRVDLVVRETTFRDRSGACSLTLATAVPKGDRFDWLVEKATELGVDRLVPLVSERSTVDPRTAKLERLRRTIIEASKQSRRDWLMEIEAPVSVAKVFNAFADSTRLIAHPGAPGIVSFRPRLAGATAVLAIGPEGGFSDAEVELAGSKGWLKVGLGQTVLRIETAALAGCATYFALAEVAFGQELADTKGAG